jgi:ribosomal protein S13
MNNELQEQSRISVAEAKVSKEATKDLHNRLVETMRQHELDQEQISNLNGEIGELNKRFEKMLVEMDLSRSENVQLRRSLKLHKQSWSDPLMTSSNSSSSNVGQGGLEDVEVPHGKKPH